MLVSSTSGPYSSAGPTKIVLPAPLLVELLFSAFPRQSLERATGRPLDAGPYLRYLKNKFGELYDLI